MGEPRGERERREYGACRRCGIVVVKELDAWVGALSGSLHCGLSPTRRHQRVPPNALSVRTEGSDG